MMRIPAFLLVLTVFLVTGCSANPPVAVPESDPAATSDAQTASTAQSTGYLFFVGASSDGNDTLYRVAPDGTDLTTIPTVAFTGQPPAVASDGSRLVYAAACHSEALMLANNDGSQPLNAWSAPNAVDVRDVTWSPETDPATEERLAFVAPRSGETYLYLIEPDTATFFPMISDQVDYADPDWSPDGQHVVYTATDEATVAGLHVVEVESRDMTSLTDGQMEVSDPQWSPNGQWIAFVAEQPDAGSDMYLIQADGSALTQLTTTAETKRDLAWSPAGDMIAFSGATATGEFDIYVINTDGEEQAHLTTAGDDLAPTWSPDGQQIAFVSAQSDDDRALYAAPATGGEPVLVTDQALQESWVAWAPQPSPESESDQVMIQAVVAEFVVDALPRAIVLEQPVEGYDRILLDEEAVVGINQETGAEEPGRDLKTKLIDKNGFARLGGELQPGATIEVVGTPDENGTLIADIVRFVDVESSCQ